MRVSQPLFNVLHGAPPGRAIYRPVICQALGYFPARRAIELLPTATRERNAILTKKLNNKSVPDVRDAHDVQRFLMVCKRIKFQ